MELKVFVNLNPQITSMSLDEFEPYIKGLEQQKERAIRKVQLDWQSELDASIDHTNTIKSCLTIFKHKKDIEDGKPGADQFAIGIAELETQLLLRGINIENSYKNWKETGKFSL